MKLNTHAFAFASSITASLWFLICAALMFMWPDRMLQLTAPLFHMSSFVLFQPFIQITLMNVISGAIQWFIYTYLIAFTFAFSYNRMVK
ncbi:MAG: DUF5676 family membrane protein [bacterium]|nr:DUF5676 family membrane protein [bacterium]